MTRGHSEYFNPQTTYFILTDGQSNNLDIQDTAPLPF